MRRRLRRKRPANPVVTAIQVVMLAAILGMVVFFRDRIGDGAGALLDSLGSTDLQVQPAPLPPPPLAEPTEFDASPEGDDGGAEHD